MRRGRGEAGKEVWTFAITQDDSFHSVDGVLAENRAWHSRAFAELVYTRDMLEGGHSCGRLE
jgi:hypothetical protein